MGYPEATQILFAAGDPAQPGGGTIRDQAVHESAPILFPPQHNYLKLTILLENELDEPVDVKLYGKTEDAADQWHQLGSTVAMPAQIGPGDPSLDEMDEITLTDWWRELKLTVQANNGADPTDGDFDSQLMPVMES